MHPSIYLCLFVYFWGPYYCWSCNHASTLTCTVGEYIIDLYGPVLYCTVGENIIDLYGPVLYCTVGEYIIATTKMRNNYAAIQPLDFSLLLLVKLSLLILFGISSLLVFFMTLFKSVKERQLYGKQYGKEAMDQYIKRIQKFKQRD